MKTCHLDSEFTARIIMSGSWYQHYISVFSLEFRSRVKYWPHRLYSLDILFPFKDYLSLKSPDTNVCNSTESGNSGFELKSTRRSPDEYDHWLDTDCKQSLSFPPFCPD